MTDEALEFGAVTAAVQEVRSIRADLKKESLRRRITTVLLSLALILSGFGIYRSWTASCEARNNVRQEVRGSWELIIERFAPPGSERRAESEAFLADLDAELAEESCP